MLKFSLCMLCLVITGYSKRSDNHLIGLPNVTCGPDEIRVSAVTEDLFEGQIYIKTQRRSPDCFTLYSDVDNATNPSFGIPLKKISSCGLSLVRNSQSKVLELVAVFVFAFHPSFVTQGDRAFAVHCVFQQQQYTVSTNIDLVRDLPTTAILAASAPLPVVQLTVVPGRVPNAETPDGKVSIGQPLMLVWSLDTQTLMYGLRVLSCSAESRDGKKMLIIDGGCTLDNTLIGDVRYSDDFSRAFADATAFKFADEEEVWFRCHVQPCIRKLKTFIEAPAKLENQCVADHKCASSPPSRDRRSSAHFGVPPEDVLVVHGRLTVNDSGYGNVYTHGKAQRQVLNADDTVQSLTSLCTPRWLFSIYSALSLSIYCITIATIVTLTCFRCQKTTSFSPTF